MEAIAKLRHLKSSAQNVRLVADLIRGRGVGEALQILRTTPKAVSKDLEILLRSAIANASQKNPSVDVDELFVSRIFVDPGPIEKRIRPAPMGRAYRIQKRRSHVTVAVAEKPASADSAKESKSSAKAAERAKRTGSSARGAAPRAEQ